MFFLKDTNYILLITQCYCISTKFIDLCNFSAFHPRH